MKTSYRHVSPAILFALAALTHCGKSEETHEHRLVSCDIADVIFKMAAVQPATKCGWESIVGMDSTLDLFPDDFPYAGQADQLFPILSPLIADQTDYECLRHEDWLVFVPKNNPARSDRATSLRHCLAPEAENTEIAEYLRSVTGIATGERVSLFLDQSFYNPNVKVFSVTVPSSETLCNRLICSLADQGGTRFWRLGHFYFTGSDGKIERPAKLGSGLVLFFDPNKNTYYKVAD